MHRKYRRNGTVSGAFPLTALIALVTFFHSTPGAAQIAPAVFYRSCRNIARFREGANREKLTVKKLINNEMFFFHRLCPL